MRVQGKPFRTIWSSTAGDTVEIIDQAKLPYAFEVVSLGTLEAMAEAIRSMQVRGAPLIGVAGVYGLALGLRRSASDDALTAAVETLAATRPTAVNLRARLDEVAHVLHQTPERERPAKAWAEAARVAEDEVRISERIAEHGAALLRGLAQKKNGARVNVLTHCNAGWLATVDWGTALAPIYRAHDEGIPVHVWVDETRPRNQGYLTAWELMEHGVPLTVLVDNAGGHLMQHGEVDVCIVGTDRTTAAGDVCNKVGTYLKALAAHDNGVPFYVAAPGSSIDFGVIDGVREIPIEARSEDEVHRVWGLRSDGVPAAVRVTPGAVPALNPAFDVTPARLVTGLITERGVCPATREGLRALYPERVR